jgi:hypothetical protein
MQRPSFTPTRFRTTLIIAVIFLAGSPIFATAGKSITGTYSNLYFNREAGDLLGVELRIAATRNGYQGVLQLLKACPRTSSWLTCR